MQTWRLFVLMQQHVVKQKSEELWGEGGKYDQMQEKLLRTRPVAPTTEDGVISILAYAGTDPRRTN